MPSASQDDLRRVLLSLRELKDRIAALEATVEGLAAHTGYEPPPEPETPALPPEVTALLDANDRRGAILALARARGISKHLADQEIKALGPWRKTDSERA